MTDPRHAIPAGAEPFGELLDALIDQARDGGVGDEGIAAVLEDRAGRERRRIEAGD